MRVHLTSHGNTLSLARLHTNLCWEAFAPTEGELASPGAKKGLLGSFKGRIPRRGAPSIRAEEEEETRQSQRIVALEGCQRHAPSLPPCAGTPHTGHLACGLGDRLAPDRCFQTPLLGSPIYYKVFCAEPKLAAVTFTHSNVPGVEHAAQMTWAPDWHKEATTLAFLKLDAAALVMQARPH